MNWYALSMMGICILLETAEQLGYNYAGKVPRYRFAWISFSVLMHMSILVFWFWVLTLLPLGIAMPLNGGTYITVALASKALFKEKINTRRWIGIAAIVLGLVLISVNAHE
jgi:undecaprenyl phosphate-alpha-L-ara4N flippase subunit ArnE